MTVPDLEVRCSGCGKYLSADWSRSGGNRGLLEVDPCDICLKEAHDEGIKEGKEAEKDG